MKLCLSKPAQLERSTQISQDVVKYSMEMQMVFLMQLKELQQAYHMGQILSETSSFGLRWC